MLFGKRLKKRAISLAGLGLLGLAVHLIDTQRPQTFDLFSDLPDNPSEPDYYTVNSTFRSFNDEGIISHSISAQRLLHYPDSQETALTSPEIITFNASGSPLWQAKAQSGLVEGDGSHFQLNQNVIVWQSASDSDSKQMPLNSATTIKLNTEQLTIDLDKDQASTDAPVTLTTAEGVTNAVGFFADMKQRLIQLKSQVRGLYPRSPAETETSPEIGTDISDTQNNQPVN